MKKQFTNLALFFALLGLVSLACGINVNTNDSAPAPAPAVTVIVMPTQPPPPTAIPPTPIPPTPIPPTVAPQQPADVPDSPSSAVPPEYQEKVDYYYDKAYLSSKEGKYIPLDDFSKDYAKINWPFLEDTGERVDDFMVTAHFEWQSAIKNPDPAGCGWAFHRTGDRYYIMWVDKAYIELWIVDTYFKPPTSFGMTNGSEYVGMGNPADADVTLIVNGLKAYVLVDDVYKGYYTLDTDDLTGKGDLAYAVVSGTNAQYGTRCQITEAVLWAMDD